MTQKMKHSAHRQGRQELNVISCHNVLLSLLAITCLMPNICRFASNAMQNLSASMPLFTHVLNIHLLYFLNFQIKLEQINVM